MWPTLYELQLPQGGSLGLHTYGLAVLLAFSAAFLLVHHRSRQVGIHPDRLLFIYLAAFVGGLAGARFLYIAMVEPGIMGILRDPTAVFALGGLAYYGGVLGGGIGVFAVGAVLEIPAWKFADVAAPALVLGLGIGRFGCFFAGCCHGAAAPVDPITGLIPDGTLLGQIWISGEFPWITTEFFPGGVTRAELMNMPLYPTQMWSVLANLSLAGLLAAMWRWRRFDGQVAATMLILQPIYRVFVESFRADHRGYAISWETSAAWARAIPGISQAGTDLQGNSSHVVVGLTTSQGIALAMILVGVGLYVWRWRVGVAPERSLDGEE